MRTLTRRGLIFGLGLLLSTPACGKEEATNTPEDGGKTADEIAKSIEKAEAALGEGRVKFVHPDCGFWMLKRSVADRKIAALAEGRDLYLGG